MLASLFPKGSGMFAHYTSLLFFSDSIKRVFSNSKLSFMFLRQTVILLVQSLQIQKVSTFSKSPSLDVRTTWQILCLEIFS